MVQILKLLLGLVVVVVSWGAVVALKRIGAPRMRDYEAAIESGRVLSSYRWGTIVLWRGAATQYPLVLQWKLWGLVWAALGIVGALVWAVVAGRSALRQLPHSRPSPDRSVASTVSSTVVSSESRAAAFAALTRAYALQGRGDSDLALEAVEQALSLDPTLAYAQIVRGEFAVQSEDWRLAEKHLARGLELLGTAPQPLAPEGSDALFTAPEVQGDAACLLGYVYVKLALAAHEKGYFEAEANYLKAVRASLDLGLSLEPSPERREIAEKLLRGFR